MSYNKFAKNCPKFANGCCKKDASNPCPYYYHKTCKYNYLCDDPECKYGHGISVDKREIIYYIDEIKYREAYFDANAEDKCDMPMNCIKKDCNLEHRYNREDREFIYMIADNTMTNDVAWDKYYSKYNNEKSRSNTALSSDSTVCLVCPSDTSRSASVDSSKNTFLSPKPLTNSYASLFKNDKVEDINSDDDIVKMMDEMMNIRKEMTTNTKHKDDIEEQIKKLKKELEQVEKKISDNKDQLKDLATKVADI
jgi:hypothetical protein|tara:strand:- start:72 stop:827 length:756 start_codon:yes stop_codon:yes gene_type:complete